MSNKTEKLLILRVSELARICEEQAALIVALKRQGAPAEQSSKAPRQQLKPEMPLLEEVLIEAGCSNTGLLTVTNQAMVSAVTKAYFYLSRHFWHRPITPCRECDGLLDDSIPPRRYCAYCGRRVHTAY